METRGAKYGRFLAAWINYTANTLPPSKKKEYKARFLKELKTYSFEPRRKGEPRNRGCTWELEEIDEFDITKPEILAKGVKEDLHRGYQKQASSRIIMSLLRCIEEN